MELKSLLGLAAGGPPFGSSAALLPAGLQMQTLKLHWQGSTSHAPNYFLYALAALQVLGSWVLVDCPSFFLAPVLGLGSAWLAFFGDP